MQPLKALIVDDSATARKVIIQHLSDHFEIDATEAPDGFFGLELARANRFDIVISDINMPRLNGLDFCARLRSDEALKDIPVLLTSSSDSDEMIERGFQAGASAFIPKPFSSHQLINTLAEVLTPAATARHRILVVDDSPIIQKLLLKGLTDAGFKVSMAADGMAAIAEIEKAAPDLIICDLKMPVMDGHTLFARIKERPEWSTIPFLVMSSNHNQETIRTIIAKGAVGYLTKPFNLNHLIVMVEKYLSDHFIAILREKQKLEYDRKMLLSTISSLASALEARDPYTGHHSEGVACFAVLIAQEMGLHKNAIELIQTAGLLHDIGKIGIRDEILLKPGKLTDEERETINAHPAIGADILSHVPSLKDVVPIVRHHHEHYDGKGYPDGLQGEEIPLYARILTVADVFHALTSKRPYREELSYEKATSIMQEDRGKILCPVCLDAFLSIRSLSCANRIEPVPQTVEIFSSL